MKKMTMAMGVLLLSIEALASTAAPPASVSDLVEQGFKFVLAVTVNETDKVFVNEDAHHREFTVGGTLCRTHVFSRPDPVYPKEVLGVISLECESEKNKMVSSASCSLRFPDTQSHFEINDGKEFYVLDLLCRSRAH